jgi:hypothetical protein
MNMFENTAKELNQCIDKMVDVLGENKALYDLQEDMSIYEKQGYKRLINLCNEFLQYHDDLVRNNDFRNHMLETELPVVRVAGSLYDKEV